MLEAGGGKSGVGLFLRINGMKLAASQEELETCATRVALKQIEIAELSDWLGEHAVPVN